ncbi:OB-fold protein [Acinetobacter seifertii]|uniref:OB-fold protein n=1 Tax=Acinetobacter seifertii TaxID=1530123 RepID=UPI00124F904E|nr:hypothetical protein [Acinetobacter seifertii]
MKKIIKWVVIAIILLIVLAAIFGPDKKKDSYSSSTTSEASTESAPAPPVPPVEVSANDLLKAYKDNEIAANNKFKDKSVLVSGTLKSIGADFSDKPLLTLKAGGEFEFNEPQATLAESDEPKAASLSKGQKIKLLCIGNSEVAGTPMLKDCVIQ